MKIALLGAESTGKTQLAEELARALRAHGHKVAIVGEVLREWCTRQGRAPRPEEQLPIAQEQEGRVELAAAAADMVVADTTALMVAIYGAMLFEDDPLYRFALARLHHYDHVLVTGLDLPWVPDGLLREGPHGREPVDALIRSALAKAGMPFRVIYGRGPERLASALRAIGMPARESSPADAPGHRAAAPSDAWIWRCDTCSDPGCEHRLFTRMLP